MVSRLLGLLRDLLVVALFGLSIDSDGILFLLSFADTTTAILAGNAALLFITNAIDRRGQSYVVVSMMVLAAAAIALIVIESQFGQTLGRLLFPLEIANSDLTDAYLLVVFSLVSSLPMAALNAVYLQFDKIHYQPLLNLIFTIIVLLGLSLVYLSTTFNVRLFGAVILVASLSRFGIGIFLARRLGVSFEQRHLLSASTTDFKLLVLGMAGGGIYLFSLVFRGELGSIGPGLYSQVSLLFKVNDFWMALVLTPLALLSLKVEKTKWQKLGLVFKLQLITVGYCVIAYLVNEILLVWFYIDLISRQVLVLSLAYGTINGLLYLLSLVLISEKKGLALLVAMLLCFSSFALQLDHVATGDQMIASYFQIGFASLSLGILVSMAAILRTGDNLR